MASQAQTTWVQAWRPPSGGGPGKGSVCEGVVRVVVMRERTVEVVERVRDGCGSWLAREFSDVSESWAVSGTISFSMVGEE